MRHMLIASCLLALMACGKGSAPKDLIGTDQFVDVMVDIHLAEASVYNLRPGTDTARSVLKDHYATIMSSHNVKPDQFLATFQYYRKHPDKMAVVYEKVIEKLSALEAEWSNKYE